MAVHRFEPVFLVGPTAAGKSEVALLLAEEIGAEIVSADSMQVYRGMDIGTAKPTAEERARVPHHLVDIVDVRHTFDVAQYRTLARAAIQDIQQRGRLPLVVGGSGMYLRALTEGLFPGPGADRTIRARLESQSIEELYARLHSADPVTALQIDAMNKRRLVRALEVLELTGKPVSAQQTQWTSTDVHRPPMIFLERNREDLHERIAKRVEWMFASGLVEETKRLLAKGLAENPTASAAAGYREVIEMLDGLRSLSDTIARVKLRTRQLAKRQLTWFRHQATLRVVKVESTVQQTGERVRELVENARRQDS